MLGREPDLSTHTMEDYTAINNDRHTYLSMWEGVHALPLSLGLVIYTLMVSCTHPSLTHHNSIISVTVWWWPSLRSSESRHETDLEAGLGVCLGDAPKAQKWGNGDNETGGGKINKGWLLSSEVCGQRLSSAENLLRTWLPLPYSFPHITEQRGELRGRLGTGRLCKATSCWWTRDWDKDMETKQVAKETLQWDRQK